MLEFLDGYICVCVRIPIMSAPLLSLFRFISYRFGNTWLLYLSFFIVSGYNWRLGSRKTAEEDRKRKVEVEGKRKVEAERKCNDKEVKKQKEEERYKEEFTRSIVEQVV